MSRKIVSVFAVLFSISSLGLSIVSLICAQMAVPEEPRPASRAATFAAAVPEETDDSPKNVESPPTPSPPPLPSLRADASLTRKLDAARDFVESDSWEEVTQLLQALLDGPDDSLVAVKHVVKGSGEVTSWTGVRTEAARVLGNLPEHGRQFYEAMYGPRARRLLAEARAKRDIHLVAEVARRYPHAAAGIEATGLLGAHHLDRGRYALAALLFERLLDRPAGAEPTANTLFHAALAFRRSGSGQRAEQAWSRVAAKAAAGLRLGGATVALDDLKKELDREIPSPFAVAAMGSGPAGMERLEINWSRPATYETTTLDRVQQAERLHVDRGMPAISAGVPVVVAGQLVFRSTRGLHAVDLRTGQEAWEVPFVWSMDRMAVEPRYATHLHSWADSYLDYSPHVLYENAILGRLSTDGERVFAVDDLGVPPYRSSFGLRGRWQQQPPWPDFGPGLTEAAYYNRLVALDAASGRAAWEVGGHAGDADDDELSDSYFFGPPLPLDDRLYVLVEKSSLLSMACLRAEDGALLWRVPVAYAPTRLLLDPGRRIQAARPVWAEGILVCPTNAGVVLGVDVLTPGLAWAYPYRTEPLTQSESTSNGRRGRPSPARVVDHWKAPGAVVDQGRVFVTAADEPSVHCLNLRDGLPVWQVGRTSDDVYMAGVIAGKLLIVGKQGCRALSLSSGQQSWWLPTGLPSGVGAASGDIYYLPLKEAASTKEPAVCVIDVRRGEVVASIRSPANQAPGNLILGQGELLSQSATAVTSYRGAGKNNKD